MINVSDVLRWYARYGWTSPLGEWGVIHKESRAEMHEALDAHDEAHLERLFEMMQRNSLYFGLVSLPGNNEEEIVRLFPMSVYWRLGAWATVLNEPPSIAARSIERLCASEYGQPLAVQYLKTYITVDTPRFDLYARRILNAIGPHGTAVEIGGGYGGVALQLLRHSPSIKIVLCDLPETLYLAAMWLSRAAPQHDVGWWDERPEAQVLLLPVQDRDRWSGKPDLVFTAHTLSGLDRASIDDLLNWVTRVKPRFIYHDDATEYVKGIWLTDTFTETLASEIVFPAPYELRWKERIPWTGVEDRFCQFFYERGGNA